MHIHQFYNERDVRCMCSRCHCCRVVRFEVGLGWPRPTDQRQAEEKTSTRMPWTASQSKNMSICNTRKTVLTASQCMGTSVCTTTTAPTTASQSKSMSNFCLCMTQEQHYWLHLKARVRPHMTQEQYYWLVMVHLYSTWVNLVIVYVYQIEPSTVRLYFSDPSQSAHIYIWIRLKTLYL